MKRSELTEFAVEEEGFKLKICRPLNGPPVVSGGPLHHSAPSAADTGTASAGAHRPASGGSIGGAPAAAADEAGIGYVKSPMVGTFYRASSPESKAFVDADAKVVESSVVCIIEAMKIMNEIQAEIKGTILEALVENGQPVEYGQRLFKVKL